MNVLARVAIAVGVVGLLTAAPPAVSSAAQPTYVLVAGPLMLQTHPPVYVLQALRRYWRVDSAGVAEMPSSHAFTVSLRRLADCALVYRFTAQPGASYDLYLSRSGGVSVDRSGPPDGPLLLPGPPLCESLPATDIAVEASVTGAGSPWLFGAVFLASLMATARWLRRDRVGRYGR